MVDIKSRNIDAEKVCESISKKIKNGILNSKKDIVDGNESLLHLMDLDDRLRTVSYSTFRPNMSGRTIRTPYDDFNENENLSKDEVDYIIGMLDSENNLAFHTDDSENIFSVFLVIGEGENISKTYLLKIEKGQLSDEGYHKFMNILDNPSINKMGDYFKDVIIKDYRDTIFPSFR